MMSAHVEATPPATDASQTWESELGKTLRSSAYHYRVREAGQKVGTQ
jgi:hypothetical protein